MLKMRAITWGTPRFIGNGFPMKLPIDYITALPAI